MQYELAVQSSVFNTQEMRKIINIQNTQESLINNFISNTKQPSSTTNINKLFYHLNS